jgi:putative ABC transport system substrate-binding protein
MKRRTFIAGLGAAAWPVLARGQQGKPARIGVLVLGNPDPEPFLKTFRAGLREIGYVEGDNIQFDIRSANGEARNLSSLASELVALKVDIIVTFQTLPATARKQATNVIPIIMGTVGDRLGPGSWAMVEKRGGKNELRPANLYQGCINAWNAYREGKTIQTIKFDTRKGLYDVHE